MEELRASLKLPRKNKAIAVGTIKKEYGPVLASKEYSHIDWFLFESADPSKDFQIIEENSNE